MDAVSFLQQMSSDFLFHEMDNLATEAMDRANAVSIERDYDNAMLNLYSKLLQQYGPGPGGVMPGVAPPGGTAMAPPFPPPPIPPSPELTYPSIPPAPFVPQATPQMEAPLPVPADGEDAELSKEQKERYDKELAELKRRQEEAEKKFELLRVHRNRYVDHIQRNGYVVNVPFRFVPDSYYRSIDVPMWYPPGLMGNRATASVWVSREPGAEVYRRMIQDSFDVKNNEPDQLQRLALSNRLFNSYGIVTAGCPPEDLAQHDDREFSIDSVTAIGKTTRQRPQNFIVHFDIYRALAGSPKTSGTAGRKDRKSARTFDLNMIEVSLHHEPQPLDAISLLFIVDGSWLGGPKNQGADLTHKLNSLGENLKPNAVKQIEKELRTRTWANLSRLLVGLESLATASTVFDFSTEREYEQTYAKAFTNRFNI